MSVFKFLRMITSDSVPDRLDCVPVVDCLVHVRNKIKAPVDVLEHVGQCKGSERFVGHSVQSATVVVRLSGLDGKSLTPGELQVFVVSF